MKKIKRSWLLFFPLALLSCANSEKQQNAADLNEKINIERAKAMFNAFNAHDWGKMTGYYAADALYLDPAFGSNPVGQSKDSIIKKYKELATYIPDVRDSLVTLFASDNKVLIEFVSVGNTVEGKRFSLPISAVLTFKDSLIVQDNTYYDMQ